MAIKVLHGTGKPKIVIPGDVPENDVTIDLPYCQELLERFEMDVYNYKLQNGDKRTKIKGFYYNANLNYSNYMDHYTLNKLQSIYSTVRTTEFKFYPRRDAALFYWCELDPEAELTLAQHTKNQGHKYFTLAIKGTKRLGEINLTLNAPGAETDGDDGSGGDDNLGIQYVDDNFTIGYAKTGDIYLYFKTTEQYLRFNTSAETFEFSHPIEGLYTSTEIDNLLSLKLDKTGGTISGDLTVTGNLTVQGTQFVADVQTVEVEDNLLLINKSETGAGVTAGTAGIEIERGSLTNYQFLFDEASDTFRIGEAGSLQPVATREDSPINSGFARWNSATFKFETVNLDIANIARIGQANNFGAFTQTADTFNATTALQINGTSIVSTFEALTNKVTSISGSSTNIQYPSAKLLYDQLALKLNLSGGTLTGHLLFTDNTYDIGASGATRPRTGYFGTSVVAPTLNITANNKPYIQLTDGSNSKAWFIYNRGDISNQFSFQYYNGTTYIAPFKVEQSAGVNTLTMSTNGVGIKKENATEALDVTGNIKASGAISSVGALSSVGLAHSTVAPQVSISDINTGYNWYLQHRMDLRNSFRVQYYNGVSYYAPLSIELDAPNNSIVANSVGVGIRTAYSSITDALTVTGNIKASGTVTTTQFKLSALNTAPANATATGTTGEIRIVDGFIYVCVAANTWKRAAIETW